MGDVGNKIPDISDLATTAVLDTKIGNVENEIPDVSGLVKKSDLILKYHTSRKNISPLLIIINLSLTYLMER